MGKKSSPAPQIKQESPVAVATAVEPGPAPEGPDARAASRAAARRRDSEQQRASLLAGSEGVEDPKAKRAKGSAALIG